MPGRLLNFRKTSPASSTVDVSDLRRDSLTTHTPSSRNTSPSPTRNHKRRSNGIDKLANRLSMDLSHDPKHAKHDKKKTAVEPVQPEPHRPAKLGIVVESPPLMLYNSPENSTGALFSGQLLLNVTEPSVIIDSFTARFICTATFKKPAADRCADCFSQVEEFHKWDFLAEPVRSLGPLKLHRGEHKFPLSYLIDGKLPATTHAVNATLSYSLVAEAKTRDGYTIPFEHPLEIKRAIIPGPEKHSIRIFPPTNLTAQVTLPSVIHPIGEFPIAMRIAGTTTRKEESQLRWKLRRVIWRIEETQKTTPPPCPKHIPADNHDDSKTVSTTDTRDVGQGELKNGWKTNADDDTIEVEFQAHVNHATKPLCNMSAGALSVKHQMIVEMVISEEWSPKKKPQQSTPTGAARVLRAQFNLVLTQRSGLGISWDEEQPPVYEDVPASPPTYMEELDLDDNSSIEEVLPPPGYLA